MRFDSEETRQILGLLSTLWLKGQSPTRTYVSSPLSPEPTVYLLLSDGEIVYAGQTSSLSRRMGQHRRNPRMAKLGYDEVVDLGTVPSHQTRLIVETIAIAAFRPKGNSALFLKVTKGMLKEIRWARATKEKALGKKTRTKQQNFGLTVGGKRV